MRRLKLESRKDLTAVISKRYQQARKKDKGKILDDFIISTSYTRGYASNVLRNHGRKIRLGDKLVVVGDVRKKCRRKRKRKYDEKVLKPLTKIWYLADNICGKRLAPAMEAIVINLENNDEMSFSNEVREKLLMISHSTIERLLKSERKKVTMKGRSGTKPGTLLRNQIVIRTFADWDEKQPGFMEIDLVGHDGGHIDSNYLQTLDMTDVFSGWTETRGVRNKAQIFVFDAIITIQARLPFKLLGLDSDNGAEFINHQLFRYCDSQKITFTRTRPYRKNDNCFVEEKNWSVVRKNVGYLRYDTNEELNILNELYDNLRLYTNYFLPTMKLKSKTRIGAKVSKKHNEAETPYKRLLNSTYLSDDEKGKLKQTFESLNLVKLKRNITNCQSKLFRINKNKNKFQVDSYVRQRSGFE